MNVFFTEHGDGTPMISLSDPAEEWCIGATITGEQVRELHAACGAWLKSAGIFPKSPPNPEERVVQEVTSPTDTCTTCGHNQIVHFMSRGECVTRKNIFSKPGRKGNLSSVPVKVDRCPCKIFTPPTPSEKEQHNGK